MKIFIKLDRFIVWVLFLGMLMYFVSGYGMTKGIISTEFATKIHLNYLTYIILVAFTYHSAFAIRLAMIRWKVWSSFGKYLWVIFYLLFVSGFVYIDKIYQKPTPAASSSTNSLSTVRAFTRSELAKYNGKNGQPSYVAVDGNVYDLTSVFQNGFHFGHVAGSDLTNAFYSQHARNALSKYPIIGKLIN